MLEGNCCVRGAFAYHDDSRYEEDVPRICAGPAESWVPSLELATIVVEEERVHDEAQLRPGDEERCHEAPYLWQLADGEDVVSEEQHPYEAIQSQMAGH